MSLPLHTNKVRERRLFAKRDESGQGARVERGEEGSTLVEVLITIIIVGLAGTALMTGFAGVISGSAVHRSLATFDTLVVDASQQAISDIQQQSSLFTTCTPLSSYPALTIPAPDTANYSAAITGVQYWNGTAFTPTCTATTSNPVPEEITVTITRTGTGVGPTNYSNTFDVTYPLAPAASASGTAAQMVFSTEPGNGSGGIALATQPQVTIEDATGTPVSSDLSPVTLAITSNASTISGCSGSELAGVVTFSGCAVLTAGTYTMTASDGSLPTVQSTSFTISAAPPSLVFTQQPVAGASASALSTEPIIKVETSGGTVVTSSTATISLTSSAGTLTNCSGLTAVSGVVNVSGCKFAGLVGTYYTLSASSSNLVGGTSNSISPTAPGPATQILFTTSPSGVASSSSTAAFTTQPVVTAEDSAGNVATSYTTAITLSSNLSTLTCSPHDYVTPTSGISSYSGCHLGAYENGVILTATSGSLTATSTSFNVTGVATKLVFATQPVSVVSGASFTTEPVIQIEDTNGNVVTSSSGTISLSASGGTLSLCSGLTTTTGVVSVASCTFSGLVGTPYTLTASLSGLTSAVSATFSPSSPGPAAQLVYTTQPVAGASGSPFTTQPVIKVEDLGGNVVTSSSSTVTLSSSGGTLAGCTNLTAVAGVIDVANCTFAGVVATPYTISATTGALTTATSSPVTPTAAGPISQVILAGCPSSLVWNTTCTLTASVEDSYNNVVTSYTGPIVFANTTGGGTFSGLGPVNATAGTASLLITASGVGSTSLTASVASPAASSTPLLVVITPAPQTITWTPPSTRTWVAGGAGTFSLGSASDSAGNTVTFASSTTSVCSVSGVTVTMLTAGVCSVTPTAPAAGNYALTVGTTANITINQIAQATLIISSSAADTYPYAITLSTSGGSGAGAVTYAAANGTATGCAANSGVATASSAGTCLVTATKASDVDYLSATSAQQTITFTKAVAAITATSSAPTSATYGSTYTPTATSTSGDTVAITSATTSVCTISSGVVTYVTTGTCTLDFNDAGNTNYSAATQVVQTYIVAKGTQATLTFSSALSDTYTYAITLSTSGGSGTGAVTYSVGNGSASGCVITSGVLSATSYGTCLVTATKAADTNWNQTSTAVTTFTFIQASQASLSMTSASSGSSPYAITLTSSGGSGTGAVTYSVTNGTASGCVITSGVLSASSAGTCLVTATKAADADYLATSSPAQTVTFGKNSQTITFASNPGFAAKGGYHYTPSATSTSGLAVTVTSATTSVCTITSGDVSFVGTGTCTLDANQAGNSSYNAAPQVTQSITVVNLAFSAGADGTGTNASTVTASSDTSTSSGSQLLVLVAFTSNNSSTACASSITASSGGTLSAVTQLTTENWGSGSLDGLCAYEATAGSSSETIRETFTGTAPATAAIDVFQITGDSEALSFSGVGDANTSSNATPIFNGPTPAAGDMEVLFAAAASSSVTDSSVPSGFALEQGNVVSPGLAEADLFGTGTTWPLTATNMLSSSQFWGTLTIDVNP